MTTTLLLNGRVHSPSHPDATAMAVENGMVAWLGSDAVGQERFPEAETIDLGGAFVAPAFVDSHVHLTATGLGLTGLDLAAAEGPEHLLRLVGEHAAAHPEQPVWGHGWDDTRWSRTPTTEDIAPPSRRDRRVVFFAACARSRPDRRTACLLSRQFGQGLGADGL